MTAVAERAIADAVAIPYAPTITLNAAQGTRFCIEATGDLTLPDPEGGVDGQCIRVEVLASAAARTLTLSGITSTISIPSGELWIGDLEYRDDDQVTDTWFVVVG